MSDLGELYQELILDHNKNPRNFGELTDATHRADGFNPLCGDKISLALRVEDGVIREARFVGSGCAISKASSSLMTSAVKGKSKSDALALFACFHDMVTGGAAPDEPTLGKLVAFAGVREFPARVKCASLAWHTLRAALQGEGEAVSTE